MGIHMADEFFSSKAITIELSRALLKGPTVHVWQYQNLNSQPTN